jgi:hypothetical protein
MLGYEPRVCPFTLLESLFPSNPWGGMSLNISISKNGINSKPVKSLGFSMLEKKTRKNNDQSSQ